MRPPPVLEGEVAGRPQHRGAVDDLDALQDMGVRDGDHIHADFDPHVDHLPQASAGAVGDLRAAMGAAPPSRPPARRRRRTAPTAAMANRSQAQATSGRSAAISARPVTRHPGERNDADVRPATSTKTGVNASSGSAPAPVPNNGDASTRARVTAAPLAAVVPGWLLARPTTSTPASTSWSSVAGGDREDVFLVDRRPTDLIGVGHDGLEVHEHQVGGRQQLCNRVEGRRSTIDPSICTSPAKPSVIGSAGTVVVVVVEAVVEVVLAGATSTPGSPQLGLRIRGGDGGALGQDPG